MLFPSSGSKNKKQETNVKQVARRAISLPRSQVYIGKQEGTLSVPIGLLTEQGEPSGGQDNLPLSIGCLTEHSELLGDKTKITL
jgi:hypothetical protein